MLATAVTRSCGRRSMTGRPARGRREVEGNRMRRRPGRAVCVISAGFSARGADLRSVVPAVANTGEEIGNIGLRIEAVGLRSFDQRIEGSRAPAGIAPGEVRLHLVAADHHAALGLGGVEALDRPLLRVNCGSTRAPDQLSSWRHFSPWVSRTSPIRLRSMPTPVSPK